MRIKLIMLSIFVIVIGGTFANWQYGTVLAKRIDNRIQSDPYFETLFDEISYSKIKVCPIASRLTFENLYVKKHYEIRSKELVLKLKYKEAQELAQTNNLDVLSKLGLYASDIEIVVKSDTIVSKDLLFNFIGHIEPRELSKYINYNQSIDLYARDLELGQGLLGDLKWDRTNDRVKTCRLNMVLDAKGKELKIKDMELVSTLLNINWEGFLAYEGNLEPKHLKFSSKIKSVGAPVEYGNINTIGLYSVEDLLQSTFTDFYFNTDGTVDDEKSKALVDLSISKAKYTFSNSFRSSYMNQLALVGIGIDHLDISDMALKSSISDGNLSVTNSYINTSIFNTKLNSNIECNYGYPKYSVIRDAKLEFNVVQPNIKNSLESVERLFGLNIPRSANGDILLELKGSLNRPLIKGLHYK